MFEWSALTSERRNGLWEKDCTKERRQREEQRRKTCIHFLTPLDNHHRTQFLCFTAGHWRHGNMAKFGGKGESRRNECKRLHRHTALPLKGRAHVSNNEGNWLRQISRHMWGAEAGGEQFTEGCGAAGERARGVRGTTRAERRPYVPLCVKQRERGPAC